ncbi:MAG: TlpA family protein disulfide reductase [Sphingobacteriales bacterium]|jgi:peroxiredoxin|nr:TlpA family protein disulfide reductase [Sphingobacteriales bacterium]OJV99974.1 MAG: hypothetical protein BGO52_02565 [Sphingobacteriales bacterium 44-61]
MGRIYSVLVLSAICLISTAQSIDSSQAAEVLKRFDRMQANVNTIYFHVVCEYVNSGQEDSAFRSAASVWLKYEPHDTIFGHFFHVRGDDKNGSYDYYYDGSKGLEARHKEKQLLLFDPYAYPNTANNPAKARTALNALHPLLCRKNITDYLLLNYPYAGKPALSGNRKGSGYLLILTYPVNRYGQQSTLYLEFDDNCMLKSTKRVTKWNGISLTDTFDIDHIGNNNEDVSDELVPHAAFPGYAKREYNGPAERAISPEEILIGEQAPDFSYQSYGGDRISLKKFRGKYVLLDFWETWCGHCIVSFPDLKDLYQRYHQLGLEIIGVSTENQEKVPGIIQANKLPYPNLKGDTAILSNYHIEGRPTYVLIGPTGKVLTYSYGDLAPIRALLDKK